MDAADIATVVTAIGNHDEGTGVPVNAVAAALILADKSDVRRSRVRNRDAAAFDIHDRVNYSVERSALRVDPAEKTARLELTVDNVRMQSKHHPRCGTSFLLIVIIVAILINTAIFALFPVDNVFLRMLVQLLLLPLVVGITYEFNRYVGGHDNPVTNFLAKPGLWMQNFTTFEPDDSMMEVAIEALKRVIPAEEGKDRW